MSVITGAFAPVLLAGCGGAYKFNGALYAIAFLQDVPANPGDNSTLGIFKSPDDGATWSNVGSAKTVVDPTTMGGDSFPPRQFGCCIDADFPSSPYAYAAYANAAGELTIARLDMSVDDWTTTSSAGPDLTDANYNSFIRGYSMEQDRDTGDFAVTFTGSVETTNTAGFFYQALFLCGLGTGLSGWTGPDLVAGQDDDEHAGNTSSYHCHAMAKGSGGRIHAFVNANEAVGGFSIQHFFAHGGPGFFGSAFTAIASPATGDSTQYGSLGYGLSDGSLVGILYTDSTVKAATNPSADILSWSIATVDAGGLFGAILTENSGTLTAIYGDGTGINFSTFNGSSWDVGAQLFPYGAGYSMDSATIENDSLHLAYSPDTVEMDYASYSVSGGGGLTGQFILPTSIPSGERFGSGAVDAATCGEASVDPVVPGCRDDNTVPTTEDPRCAVQGFAL